MEDLVCVASLVIESPWLFQFARKTKSGWQSTFANHDLVRICRKRLRASDHPGLARSAAE
jgi:hypothetical protein